MVCKSVVVVAVLLVEAVGGCLLRDAVILHDLLLQSLLFGLKGLNNRLMIFLPGWF